MQTYVVLWNFTDQGMQAIKSLPERVQENTTRAEQAGMTIKASYLTEGPYDFLSIIEAPDEQSIVAGLLTIAGGGNSRSLTLRAFSMDEVAQIIQKMP